MLGGGKKLIRLVYLNKRSKALFFCWNLDSKKILKKKRRFIPWELFFLNKGRNKFLKVENWTPKGTKKKQKRCFIPWRFIPFIEVIYIFFFEQKIFFGQKQRKILTKKNLMVHFFFCLFCLM